MKYRITNILDVSELVIESPSKTELSALKKISGAQRFSETDIIKFPLTWPVGGRVVYELERCGMLPIDVKTFFEAKAQDTYSKVAAQQLPVVLPADFFHYEPFAHQKLAMLLASYLPCCGWLYDRGLGKTKIAIDTARMKSLQYSIKFPTLVITPPVTIPSWQSEVELHSKGSCTSGVFIGPKKEKVLQEDYDFVFTSYETARTHWESLAKKGFLFLIFDESHRLRDPESKQSQACMKLSYTIPHKVIMTGSPMTDPRHLFMQMSVLSPALIYERTWSAFQEMFLVRSPINRHIVTGFRNMMALRSRVNSVCVYRKKEDCLDLPPKTWIDVKVAPSDKIRRSYNSAIKDYKVKLGEHTVELLEGNGATLLTALMQISRGWLNESNVNRNICDECPHLENCIASAINPYTKHCKVEQKPPLPTTHFIDTSAALTATNELIEDIVDDPSNKVIVWFKSNYTLGLMSKTLGDMPHLILKGGSNYGEVLSIFNDAAGPQILLAQIQCGIGWSATIANYSIYVEPTLVPEHYEQSMDRNHRPGQTRNVTYYRILVDGSVDAGVYSMLEQGINLGAAVCGETMCLRCQKESKCVLGLCEIPGISPCSFNSFISKGKLKTRSKMSEEFDATFSDGDTDYHPD